MGYLLDLIIDPGHGGAYPGAVSSNVREKDIVLEMSLYQLQRAKELGLRAGITRSGDQTLSLEQHAARVTISRARICLSNHINAGGGFGAEVYHSVKHTPRFGQLVMEELKAAGSGVHGITGVLTRMSSKYPGKDYYRMHYTGDTETLIVEYGYIDNPINLKLLLDKKMDFAEAALKAVCRYLDKPYSLPGTVKLKPQLADPDQVTILAAGREFTGKLVDLKTWAAIAPILRALGHEVIWYGDERKVVIK